LTTVTVNTQISGILTKVGFQEGQLVHKGDFLAQIDPRPYEVALEEDRAQLARDAATLEQAKMDLERYKTLSDQSSIARQTYEDQAWVVKQDQGTVDYDKAQIKAQQLNLVYCHIVAPADGRVGLRLIDPGNYVQTSTTSGIVVLTVLDPISVIYSVPEDSIPSIQARLHSHAKLSAVAFDRANVKQLAVGEFASIDNEVDTTTGTVRLRANFDNAADALFPSQFVNVQMLLDTLKNVVTVPIAAVQRGAPGTYAFVVGEDNTVRVQVITLGPQDAGYYAVESGLAPGDRVVTEGADRLREGARVIVPAAAAAVSGAAAASGAEAAEARQGRRHHGGDRAHGDGQSSSGGDDADAAARRERWRQRHQQDNQNSPGNPQAPSGGKNP
jgi:multidrug efflux system membrane fusion protein